MGPSRGVEGPLTRLSFQMIESNDISGEKIRMKEAVEGEWPPSRAGCGALGKGWLALPPSWLPLKQFALLAVW